RLVCLVRGKDPEFDPGDEERGNLHYRLDPLFVRSEAHAAEAMQITKLVDAVFKVAPHRFARHVVEAHHIDEDADRFMIPQFLVDVREHLVIVPGLKGALDAESGHVVGRGYDLDHRVLLLSRLTGSTRIRRGCSAAGRLSPLSPTRSALRITLGSIGSSSSAGRNMPAPASKPAGTSATITRGRRWKCVKVCRTSTPASRQPASNGGCGSGGPSAQSVPGNPSIPPSSPRAGRSSTSTAPSARTTSHAMPCRTGRSVFGVLRGSSAAMPRRRPAQGSCQGQIPQAGRRGVQMVAPRSITACAWSPARSAGVSRDASP